MRRHLRADQPNYACVRELSLELVENAAWQLLHQSHASTVSAVEGSLPSVPALSREALCPLRQLCVIVAGTDNKQAFIVFLLLFAYALYWIWPQRDRWRPTARTCACLVALGLALGA